MPPATDTSAAYHVHLPQRRSTKSRRVRDDDTELIINAHLEGYLPWEIDEALSYTAGTAERVLEENEYKSRFRVPKSEYEQYPRLYMVERMSLQGIADKFSTRRRNRSPGTIKVYLLMIGFYLDGEGKRKKVRIRHPGHRGKSGKSGTKRRLH